MLPTIAKTTRRRTMIETECYRRIIGKAVGLKPTLRRYYNLERSHQGYRLRGRTPAQALRETLAIETLPPIVPEPEVTAENEPDTLAA